MEQEIRDIRIKKLEEAFRNDGYEIVETIDRFDRLGVMAEHKTAFNYDTGQKKRIYYLEGTHFEMGYLLGFLAEKQIREMTGDFSDNLPFSFLGSSKTKSAQLISDVLIHMLSPLVKASLKEQPQGIKDELRGIMEGCRERNRKTDVTLDRLYALNLGFDAILSMVYTGILLLEEISNLQPIDLNIPLMCNAFSVFGGLAGNGHYFGRDFMFPSAGVFQRTATMLVCNPASENGKRSYPFVSVTAPGLVGSISAMNNKGAVIGVDMSPGSNCNPYNPGVNSLILCRRCIQYGSDCNEIIKIMSDAKRGVSWNYVVSDGSMDKACVIEAGRSQTEHDGLRVTPINYRTYLPDSKFIKQHWSAKYTNGMMVRWNDYLYPSEYLDFDMQLWNYYNKRNSSNKILYSDALGPKGFINKSWEEQNCPSTFYFAPQRENYENLLLATNHFIIPEMQFYAMHPWTSKILGLKINDIQWRYDALNHEIMKTLEKDGHISYSSAKQLIDFLAPYGKYSAYYEKNPRSRDGKEICIEGCTSVFDLKNLLVESHFGYYHDEWIKVTLPRYVQQ